MNKLYTNEEFKDLVEFSNTITTHIPEDRAGYVWHNYRKISGSNENSPCMCSSSAGLWRKAIETIRDYIKQNSQNYNG